MSSFFEKKKKKKSSLSASVLADVALSNISIGINFYAK